MPLGGRPCGSNKWASHQGKQLFFPQKNCGAQSFWADLVARLPNHFLASLSLIDSQGQGHQNSREVFVLVPCPSCLCGEGGGWKPALEYLGVPPHLSPTKPVQQHLRGAPKQALPAVPRRLEISTKQLSLAPFPLCLTGDGEGPGCSQNRPCILEVTVKGHWEWCLWGLVSFSAMRNKCSVLKADLWLGSMLSGPAGP